ncbi:hypothetical protein ACJ73_02728 [Blastomyces percursus]|uniref:Uncharacterized protein n=1 Tax=Blastomyces percursus TaxID=1658174 RepID=A0A1J9QCT4_9EURO|nr:hypothetical protein ACJ73_02728 [Blastomyces percursus]
MPLSPRPKKKPQRSSPRLSLQQDKWTRDRFSGPAGPYAKGLPTGGQLKTAIGDCHIERQESWTTFVIGPIKKSTLCFDGKRVTPAPVSASMLLSEVRGAAHQAPIMQCNWTKKSLDPNLQEGYAWVGVQASGAHLFPNKLRLFSRPVTVNRIRKSPKIPSCTRCHGFHMERNCARPLRCRECSNPSHPGDCQSPARCCNCCGPHPSSSLDCPARPKVVAGQLERIPRRQLRSIREAGKKAFILAHQTPTREDNSETNYESLSSQISSPLVTSTATSSSQASQLDLTRGSRGNSSTASAQNMK